jgi:hypothetical protein
MKENKIVIKLKELHIKIVDLIEVVPFSRAMFYVYVDYYENEYDHEKIPNDVLLFFNTIMSSAQTQKDVYDSAYEIFKYSETQYEEPTKRSVHAKRLYNISTDELMGELKRRLLCEYSTNDLLKEIKRRTAQ